MDRLPLHTVEELTAELDQRTRELARVESRFRDIIERHADAIVVVDRSGVIRYANHVAATMFATPADALVGTQFGFPIVVDETTTLDLLANGSPRVVEMRVVQSEWEGSQACIASLRDITERTQAEESARRLIREQAARTAAEEAGRRLRFLADSTTALSASLDYGTTLATLARLCVAEICDWAVVHAVDPAGRLRRVEVAHRNPAAGRLIRELQHRRADGNGPAAVDDVLRTRRHRLVAPVTPEQIAAMCTTPCEAEIIGRLGVSSVLHVPMIARDHLLGAISLVIVESSRTFSPADVALAEDMAGRAALAVDNARLYGETETANHTKADFLAVVSHDLRTPLNAIIGYADLLDLGIPDVLSVGSRQAVDRIRTSANHLLYLLNQLLAFARLDAGGDEVRMTEIDVRDVARDVAAVMEPLAQGRELAFHLELPDARMVARTDPDKLRQVLLNLVGNAVQYTPRGEISVEAATQVTGGMILRVRDTGVGIAPEHLERVFQPFWQVDATQRTRGGGTGLGLSVVRRTMEMLGGDVHVESAVGRGTTFTVFLPDGEARELGVGD